MSLQDGVNGYQGTRDTSIRGDDPNANFGVKSKMELDGHPDQISLVRWDTTPIPSSVTVTSVSLTFNVINTSTEGYEIYNALRGWDETSATYLLAAAGQPWETPGANGTSDRADDVLGTITGPSIGLVTIQLNALGVAVVQNWVANPLSNFGILIQDLNDSTTDDLDLSSSEASISVRPKLTITYLTTPPAPTVTVNTLLTNKLSPPLTGTVSDPAATISVTVGGQATGGVNHGDGTWTLAENQLAPLAQGVYDVAVTATTSGNSGTDATTGELSIDATAPSTTLIFPLDNLTYDSVSWTDSIRGTASDLGGGAVAQVKLSIKRLSDNQFWNGTSFGSTAEVLLNSSGTTNWTLPLSDAYLANGEYTVIAHATDTAGNVEDTATENTATATFTFDATPPPAPTVTVDTLLTNDSTPPLRGTVSRPEATVSVEVGGLMKGAVNHGDGTWTLADNELAALAQGVYDVVVTATAGSVGTDATTNELTVDTTTPSTTIVFPLDGSRYLSATWTQNIQGTAVDTGGASLNSVKVSVLRLSDSRYWSGSAWDQTSEYYLPAAGTMNWSLGLSDADLTDGVSYTVSAHSTDSAGNVENAKTATFAIDNTRPVLTSFTRQAPASSPTNADTLVFRATFDESVTNVSADDFVVTGTSATITIAIAISPSTYNVTVSGGDLSSLNGSVGLDLASGQDIADLAGNTLPGSEPITDQLYVVDNSIDSIPIVVSLQDGLNGYQGTRDTSIRGDLPTTNYGLKTKMELDGSPDQISLVRWDSTSIPSSSTAISVSLTFNVINTSTAGYEIYKALRAWDEMTATYLLAASGQPWGGPGATGSTDRSTDILASLTGPSTGLVTIQLNALGVAMVQNWITNPSSNYGIVIQDLNDTTSDDLDVSSREQSGQGPKLTVTYTLGPPPPPNDPPTAANDSYSVNEDASLNVSTSLGVLSNDTDPEGDVLAAIRISGPSHGTLTLNPSGSFDYTPEPNFNGGDSFTYRVGDGAAHSSGGTPTNVGTVAITVTAQPDSPLAENDSLATTKNSSRSIDVLSNDSDPDGDSISVSGFTQPSHGSLSQNAGTFTYVPASNYTGTDSFSYTIRDTTGRTDAATVSIDVTGAFTPVTFRAMGDVPYSQGEYSELQDDLANVGSKDLFFMHVGDIKSGSGACSSSVYSGVANILRASQKTVFIIPGDNEWNDCSNPDQAWGYWENNFSRFDEHWSNSFTVRRQAQRDENFAFVHGGILFIGINLVGGTVHDSQEWAQRMNDNSQWVSNNFATYRDQVSSAVVFAQAYPDGARKSFGDAFVIAAKQFQKPVLYLMGDLHSWKQDHPFSGAPNVTRVVVDQGVPSVRVTVTQDPTNPFQFDRTP